METIENQTSEWQTVMVANAVKTISDAKLWDRNVGLYPTKLYTFIYVNGCERYALMGHPTYVQQDKEMVRDVMKTW